MLPSNTFRHQYFRQHELFDAKNATWIMPHKEQKKTPSQGLPALLLWRNGFPNVRASTHGESSKPQRVDNQDLKSQVQQRGCENYPFSPYLQSILNQVSYFLFHACATRFNCIDDQVFKINLDDASTHEHSWVKLVKRCDWVLSCPWIEGRHGY